MGETGRERRRTREQEVVAATATYWNREERLRRLGRWKAVRVDGEGDWRRLGLLSERGTGIPQLLPSSAHTIAAEHGRQFQSPLLQRGRP